jgi:ammonium transporter Rh
MKIEDLKKLILLLALVAFLPLLSFASELSGASLPSAVINDQRYNKAIHIMVMLLIGFGFLMVFVRKYGRSALTATFLLVSTSLPLYMLIKNFMPEHTNSEIDSLIYAEFGAASLLIAAGAILGRLKMQQYILLGLLFIPFYIINEWIVLQGGLGLIPSGAVADTGGSIIIHAFGAIFGLGVALTMTTKEDFEKPVEADSVSDRYSMIGSMALWIFWPSFCAALVSPERMPLTVINVILALSGSTLATYFTSVSIRKKIAIADIANAALAGGVAIGSTCDTATPVVAMIIAVLAGVLSTVGFAVIQSKQQRLMKIIDTCGVTNLHGLPGLMGGLAALFVVSGLNTGIQLMGIVITIFVALLTGYLSGKILLIMGRRAKSYEDAEEFLDAED